MLIKLNEGDKQFVNIFDDIRSHEMSTPSKVAKIRFQNKMTVVSKKMIDELYYRGIGQ